MDNEFPLKYESAKTSIYIGVAIIILSVLVVFLFSDPLVRYISLLLIFASVGSVVRDIVNYRAVWLHEDKLQQVDIVGNYFYEIYYSEIKSIGFLNASVGVETSYANGQYGLSSDVAGSELVIFLKDGERKELRKPDIVMLQEVYSFITQRMAEGNLAQKPAEEDSATSVSALKFESPETMLYVLACVAVADMMMTILFLKYALYIFAGVGFFTLLVVVRSAYTMYTDFIRIRLYDKKMVISDFSGQTLREIYYSDIRNIGFLHSTAVSTYSDDGESYESRLEELVIIFKDGDKEVISEEVGNLHELCAFVQTRI